MRARDLFESKTYTLYHGTCSDALTKTGWTPGSGPQGGNMGQTRYLYLSTDPEDARWFANEKGCDVVLVLHNVPEASLIVDPEDGSYDTLHDEMNSPHGLPGKVALTRPLSAEHFSVYGTLTEAKRGAFMRDEQQGVLPATPENIAAAKAFVFEKWKERWQEQYGDGVEYWRAQAATGRKVDAKYYLPPADLSSSCKFSSMFARAIFGGKLEGNYDHQFVVKDGKVIDLNLDAADVAALQSPHSHDDLFWGSQDHKASLRSCAPRVEAWVKEFLAQDQS